ncbi:MAG: hypothetical protein JOZ13_10155 [Alphaproteobacteria bacterium]|nr:hypothetical protein [Alphaproteobacteria bacterium]
MTKRGLNQAALARLAKVSQSTVCRALSGVPMRRSAARDRLFSYAEIVDARYAATDRVIAAFRRIWDNTDEHADAVIDVIGALGKFRTKRTRS